MDDYLILNLARGLAGDRTKRLFFGLGESGSGKTVITQAIMSSCGDYAGSFNAENLAYRNTVVCTGTVGKNMCPVGRATINPLIKQIFKKILGDLQSPTGEG